MRTPIEEREVVIRFNTDDETANIYTSDYSYMTKLDKLCENNPAEWRGIHTEYHSGDIVGKFYECPYHLISFRKGSTQRTMTDEQKAAAADRLAKAREARKNK